MFGESLKAWQLKPMPECALFADHIKIFIDHTISNYCLLKIAHNYAICARKSSVEVIYSTEFHLTLELQWNASAIIENNPHWMKIIDALVMASILYQVIYTVGAVKGIQFSGAALMF